MRVRPVSAAKWAKYEAITDSQKYFVYRVLELCNENIPLYLDLPLLTFRGLLAEIQPILEEARAGRVYRARVRELLQSIARHFKPTSVWREILGTEAQELLRVLGNAEAAIGADGEDVLGKQVVRTAEPACIGLSRRLETPEGLGPVIEFVQGKLANPDARYAYVDKLAVLLVSESLHAGFSKRAILRLARWCFLEASIPQLSGRLDQWREYLNRPLQTFTVTIPCTLPKLVGIHPPHGCTIAPGGEREKWNATLQVDAKDPWAAALLAYERLLDILEPYGIAQPGFVPAVPRRGIKVSGGGHQTEVDLPQVLQKLPDFSIEQVLALEQLAHVTPPGVHKETLTAIRATLAQIRESLTASAESRLLHLWIAAETLLGSHRASSVNGIIESLPIFVAFWSAHKRLEDLWTAVQPSRPALGNTLDSVDNASTSAPDMREWMAVLVNNAAEIAGAVDPELIKGRILWMGGALTQAADHTRPLGNYLRDLIEEIVHEIYYLTRVRGRLIHRGRSEQSPDYAARRLAAYVLRALNAILFVLSTTPSQSLETIISSYIVAYERASATLREDECGKTSYDRFIAPRPPFV